MNIRQLMVGAGLLASCGPASAASANVTFSGSVEATCSLLVTNGSGTLVHSPSLGTLSSKHGGGASGALTVSTTGGVNLSIDPVSSPIQPPADLSTTLWAPTFSVSGTHSVLETSAASPLAAPGTSAVKVDLTATKLGADTFKPGTYGATVTVRCEP